MSTVFDSVHEECGVFAVYCKNTTDAAMQTYVGLYALSLIHI